MSDTVLALAASSAAFSVLQAASEAPAEHVPQVNVQLQTLADAIGDAVAQAVLHIQQFAQASGTVQTVVATTGTAAAQTGTGVGTATIIPGGIT